MCVIQRPLVIGILGLSVFSFLTSCVTGSRARKGDGKSDGVYFNKETKRYYVNRNSRFSLKQTENNMYIDRIEVSVDNEPFHAYEDSLEFSSEGSHSVRFRSVDPVGNTSSVTAHNFYVDLTPPIVKPYWEGQYLMSGNTWFMGPDSVLKLESQDNLSGTGKILYRQGEQGKSESYQGTIKLGKGGRVVLFISATDNVGNQSDWQPLEVYLDNAAPKVRHNVIGKVVQKGETVYVANGTPIEITANDDGGAGVEKIEYQLENQAIAMYRQPIVMRDKTAQFSYRAIDKVGNASEWRKFTLVQDTEAPNIAVKEGGNFIKERGMIFAQPKFKLIMEASDNQSGVEKNFVSQDRRDFIESKTSSVTFDRAGIYNVAFRSIDTLGNLSESDTFTVYIDDSVEPSTYSSKQKLVKMKEFFLSALPNSIEISGKDDGVGIDHIEISYDGKDFNTLNGVVDLTTWSSPRRTLYFRGVDRLGNKEKAQNIQIQIQSQSPAIDLFVDSDNVKQMQLSKPKDKEKEKEKESVPAH